MIVALNSDTSVQRLKGPDRPIQDEETRALVLASLSIVDGVVLFEDETPQAVIEKLCPHVLIKGSDYKGRPIAGADFVKKRGGKVILIDLLDGHSTTKTVAKMETS